MQYSLCTAIDEISPVFGLTADGSNHLPLRWPGRPGLLGIRLCWGPWEMGEGTSPTPMQSNCPHGLGGRGMVGVALHGLGAVALHGWCLPSGGHPPAPKAPTPAPKAPTPTHTHTPTPIQSNCAQLLNGVGEGIHLSSNKTLRFWFRKDFFLCH